MTQGRQKSKCHCCASAGSLAAIELYAPAIYGMAVSQHGDYYIILFPFNQVFFVFNLIPVYPLDGFRIVETFNKKRGKIFRFLRYYGIYVLYALFLLGFIADIIDYPAIDILGRAISFVAGWVGMPITLFWGLIF